VTAQQQAFAIDGDPFILEITQRLQAEQLAIEATVACGAVAGSPAARIQDGARLPLARPTPCSDAEELRCRWMHSARRPDDLEARTELRPPSCPRRLQLERERWERSPERARRARLRRIPEPILDLVLSGAGPGYAGDAVKLTRAWFVSNKHFLVLSGPEGSGKTYAACRWLESQPRGLFLTCEELRPNAKAKAEAEVHWRQLLEARCLVIDALMAPDAALIAKLDELLVALSRKGGRAIITSRTPLEQLRAALFQDGQPGPGLRRLELYGRLEEIKPVNILG